MVQPRSRAGFTFTELAIVTAIIAVVLAVLYPVFQTFMYKSHGPACYSNMRQLGLAYVQYEQDADNHLPSGINASGNGWAGQLYVFTKSTRVYQCRDDTHDGSYISYAENQNIAGQNLKKFTDIAATVELYETTTLNCDPSHPESVSATGISAPQDSTRHDSPQARFALNFGFADGHVKLLTPEQVSGGPNAVPPKRKGTYTATFSIR